MKQNKFILGAFLALVVAGCSDEVVNTEITLPVSGDEIVFGAEAAQLSEPASRTVYGEPGDYDNYAELAINWKPGEDQVRVYSPQASSECQSADYTVQQQQGTDSYFLQKNGDIGVRWGNVNETHEFYSFYPLSVDGGAQISGLTTDTKVSATIPVAQEKGSIQTKENKGTTWKIVAPNMSYCMMAGQGTWTPGTDKGVSLTFTPIVLVLDVVVNAGDTNYDILGVSVQSKDQPIVGSFTYDVETEEFSYTSPSGDDNTQAWVDCQQDGQPLTLEPGQKLNVKFFLLPRNIQASELTVSVLLKNGQTLRQALVPTGNSDVELISGNIVKVRTPKIKPAETSNWMSMIDDDVLFASQLSLPGTKYSYTYTQYDDERNSYNSSNQIMQTYQTRNISQQFDAGIRAFDIKINTGGTPSHPNRTNGAYIYVNGEDLQENNEYQSLGGMLTLLKEKLDAAPTEFVIVSINWVDNGRSANQWVSDIERAVATWSEDNQREDTDADGTTLNDGDLDYFREVVATTTVGVMRQGIGILIHAPESYTGATAPHLNIIEDYSSSVQNTTLVQNIIESDRGNGYVHIQNLQQMNNPNLNLYPYYITEDYVLDPTTQLDLIQTKKDLIDELFTMSRTNNASGSTTRTSHLYVNDLGGFCVVNHNNSTGWADAETAECHSGILGWNYSWDTQGYYLKDYRVKDNYTYFNDPTNGYYWNRPEADRSHDGETSLQITGRGNVDKGEGGNNALLAEQINPYTAGLIYDLVNEGRTPLGVVYMNFAGDDHVTIGGETYNVSGVQLPSLIMSNNFKFALATSAETTSN